LAIRTAWCGACVGLLAANPAAAQLVDTVLVGSSVLRGASLPLGMETVESSSISEGNWTRISSTSRTISRGKEGDVDTYVIATTHVSSSGNTTTATIIVRAADFALIHHKVKARSDSTAMSANAHHLTGWVVLSGQPARLIDQTIDRPVFPIEGQMPWLLPLLPYQDRYAVAIPRFSPWFGGEVWGSVEVLGTEAIEYGGTVLECWKVDTGELGPPGYRSIRWIDKSSRRIIRTVLRGLPSQPEYWTLAQ